MERKYDCTDELALAVQLMRADARQKGERTPVFLHFSDVHGSAERLDAVVEFFGEHRDIITDIIHTGDSVNNRYSDGLSPEAAKHLGYVLNIVGNHDMLGDRDGWDWSIRVSEAELYDLLFRDRAEGREVVIEPGKTYWYKDFEPYKLRLIGVNACLGADEAQLTWLEATLDGALEAGYRVLIASHYPPANERIIECSFSTVALTREAFGGRLSEAVQAVVDGFKKAGGEFICYLCGDTHTDLILVNRSYPDQLAVTVDSSHISHANYWSDTFRVKGTKSEELFNLFSYDTNRKVIKIVRFGANADCLLRSKRSLCVSYLTGEVVSQS